MDHSNTRDNNLLDLFLNEVRALVFARDVAPDSTLAELGFDSVIIVDLLIRCEEIYSITIQPELLRLDEFTTLRSMHEQLMGSAESSIRERQSDVG